MDIIGIGEHDVIVVLVELGIVGDHLDFVGAVAAHADDPEVAQDRGDVILGK